MYKRFDKTMHGMVQSDLDVTDFINYDCIYKITSERVLDLLKTMEDTKGTVLYLELIQCSLKSYMEHDTSISDRLFMVSFLKLLRLIIDKRAYNISEDSSQQCESEFHHVRSLTGIQSTQINWTPKIFHSRLHKIELCEQIMFELKDEISFPGIEQREETQKRVNEDINSNDINIIIENEIFAATEKAEELGIYHEETLLPILLFWIKMVKILNRSTRLLLFKMLNFLGLDHIMDILQLKTVMQ